MGYASEDDNEPVFFDPNSTDGADIRITQINEGDAPMDDDGASTPKQLWETCPGNWPDLCAIADQSEIGEDESAPEIGPTVDGRAPDMNEVIPNDAAMAFTGHAGPCSPARFVHICVVVMVSDIPLTGPIFSVALDPTGQCIATGRVSSL